MNAFFGSQPARQGPSQAPSEVAFPPIVVVSLKRYTQGSLRGFVDLFIPGWKLTFHACTFHESHGKKWVGLASKPQIDRAGNVLRDARNRVAYTPVITFADEVRDRFSRAAVRAIEAFDPQAFEPVPAPGGAA